MRSGDPRSERVGAEGGYTLVVVIVMITVLNVAIATAAPLWSTVLQREREAELVFRGMQYAEAIRVFEARHGRQPLRLEELLKVKPRSIRQLWVDPMTGEPDWDLVYQDVRKIRGADARSALHPGTPAERSSSDSSSTSSSRRARRSSLVPTASAWPEGRF